MYCLWNRGLLCSLLIWWLYFLLSDSKLASYVSDSGFPMYLAVVSDSTVNMDVRALLSDSVFILHTYPSSRLARLNIC